MREDRLLMNILFYFGNQINPCRGGTERVAYLIADFLKRRGHQVYYMACTRAEGDESVPSVFLPTGGEGADREDMGFVLSFIQQRHIEVIVNEGGSSEAVYLFSHEHIPEHVRIVTHLHFDVLGDNKNFYKSLCLPLCHVPLLQAMRNGLKWVKAPYNKWRALRNKQKRYQYMWCNSDKVVLLSGYYRDDFLQLVQRPNNGKVVAFANPLTYTEVGTGGVEKQNSVIYVGRLDFPQKRVDRVLRVWSRLERLHPNWQLTIVGDGTDKPRLLAMSQRLKLQRVSFAGHVNPQSYYQRAKMLLLTSNFEGTPMVIHEAMAHGVVPVVMGTFAGVHDMIQHQVDGMITRPFDIDHMVQMVERLMDDNALCENMSLAAMLRIQRHDNASIFEAWEKLIRE